MSELLASALSAESARESRELEWRSQPMGARVDIGDKEALRRALDEP